MHHDAPEPATDLDWARNALAALRRPDSPVTAPWECSIAALVGAHPKVPGAAVKLLGLLDGIGEVAIAPDRVGFDGRQVPWEKVLEVRTHASLDRALDTVVDIEVERVRKLFPPVPGRKWLVTKASEILLTVMLAATELAEREDFGERPLPCEMVYVGRLGRPRERVAGLFAATALAAIPEAGATLMATARARGIPVVPAVERTPGGRLEQARRLRQSSLRLTERLRALSAGDDEVPVLDSGSRESDV